jgi:hypothetical protein
MAQKRPETLPEAPTTLQELQQDPKNRRQHNARNLEMLQASIKEVGASRSIVIDEHGEILAGNGVVQAATAAGLEKVRIVDADGDTVIAVRRTGLSDAAKRALAIYDNRTAELAAWDYDQLREDQSEGLSLQPFWSEAEELMLLGQEAKPGWSGMPEYEQEDQQGIHTLRVHFQKQEDVQAFAALIGQDVTTETKFIWYPKAVRDHWLERECKADDEEDPPADVS